MHLAQSLTALRLDPESSTPMFRQLYDAIKAAILSGQITPGVQLPPTREFALLLGVSRQTVLNAFSQLMAEGFLSGTIGKGTFVSHSLSIALTRGKPDVPAPHPAPLRPLSNRGQCFVGEKIRLNTHQGTPRPFRIGMPGIDVFPFDVWARLEARRWRRPVDPLGYGDPAGYRPLRELLAAYLRASRGVHCTAEQIIVTSGSQQALFLIATMLLAPGDAAWMEDPGYQGIGALLHAVQAKICPIPVDEQGISIAHGMAHHADAKLAYVTPSHQYPLGVTMSLQRRLELLDWAAKNRMWVVEDEYDSDYRYTGRPLASLQSLDRSGCVIYVGTLSKVLFPGLRLGYLVAPPALVEAFSQGKGVLDRHTAIVPQIVLSDFIAEGHFSRHIRRTREIYAERRTALLESLDAMLADEIRLGPTDAGLHIAGAFVNEHDDKAVAEAALRKGIEVRALSRFYATPDRSASGLLLGFATATPDDIRRGVATLKEVLKG
ncbi:PLP-dependent aminotransferase family protein [Noviherbaspirillum cavernae]|uniref:PLP-dependent aminotransferase family protein n=1 Tax=Noviherbaspirillum cavernae TaxID=2320862 RepID=A0A418X2A3_9BURK|nr:PLP-dependent aminotransferase family protein [Noviherbaspirillum cavernae]RJG06582.1 PLP-dependent aminotransferase family protein [Noviherbaspirillum cavernae]